MIIKYVSYRPLLLPIAISCPSIVHSLGHTPDSPRTEPHSLARLVRLTSISRSSSDASPAHPASFFGRLLAPWGRFPSHSPSQKCSSHRRVFPGVFFVLACVSSFAWSPFIRP
ncbi:hypothetical protein B0H17DRAFT_1074394 [Mycena rosella]|uniref:Uncharacterized protein n=1 Tax=Mycena rosella TaxID=1033263 RepID=A0AAD7GAE1_MYCRO|nr:hypothetical protein B0H17DRAFT_1074394 [Mycena rosella]